MVEAATLFLMLLAAIRSGLVLHSYNRPQSSEETLNMEYFSCFYS